MGENYRGIPEDALGWVAPDKQSLAKPPEAQKPLDAGLEERRRQHLEAESKPSLATFGELGEMVKNRYEADNTIGGKEEIEVLFDAVERGVIAEGDKLTAEDVLRLDESQEFNEGILDPSRRAEFFEDAAFVFEMRDEPGVDLLKARAKKWDAVAESEQSEKSD